MLYSQGHTSSIKFAFLTPQLVVHGNPCHDVPPQTMSAYIFEVKMLHRHLGPLDSSCSSIHYLHIFHHLSECKHWNK